MFAGNFAPRAWAFCDGQLLAVSSNDALFSLLGTIYGGDGRTTFGLPDLRGRIPIHAGSGPGLSPRKLGAKSGVEKASINANQLPSHSHNVQAAGAAGDSQLATDRTFAQGETQQPIYRSDSPSATMHASMIQNHTGGGQGHNNLMPTLCIHFIIALVGIYPSRH